ncbi:MAG: hypothetical protein JGK08_02320 [Microcoleus sp. PH2017_04_SCI_O_A]|nr:hypothetical protein [Microcoleus sp. PH2017_04_SCI_O_A]
MPEALASQGQKQQLSDKKLLLKLAKKYVADKKTLYILAESSYGYQDLPTLRERFANEILQNVSLARHFIVRNTSSPTVFTAYQKLVDFGGDGFPALQDWSTIPPQSTGLSSHTNL